MSAFELKELSKDRDQPQEPTNSSEQPTNDEKSEGQEPDQAVAFWAYASTAIIISLAIPMMLFPRVLLFASGSSSVGARNALTPLESFLCLHGGILLSALAAALLFNIPANPIMELGPQASPQGHPLLVPLSTACSITAFLSYNTSTVSSLGFLISIGAAIIGGWGMWTILFAGSSYRSKKTGADKRTSRFLFGNKAAASSKKKEWKKQQKSGGL